MRVTNGLFLFILLFLFSACGKEASSYKPFYDLKAYFNKEAIRLAAQENIAKTVVVNGQTESKVLDSLSWIDEFQAFMNADINMPAWFDKYQIDSSFFDDSSLKSLRYTAIDTTLRTRMIDIDFLEGTPSEINIERISASPLAETVHVLQYIPKGAYSFTSVQKLRRTAPKEVKVNVSW